MEGRYQNEKFRLRKRFWGTLYRVRARAKLDIENSPSKEVNLNLEEKEQPVEWEYLTEVWQYPTEK